MDPTKFAVLDVETTSGDPTTGRVMEVAVIVQDGPDERMRWDSLVDPRTTIPAFARRLTGITNSEVKRAPPFSTVVNTLQTLTQDRIVVAHNVRFDMTALEHEFARTGLRFERTTLCTERAARRLLPQRSQYNLASLSRHFSIPLSAAHRAMADAQATSLLFGRLLIEFGEAELMLGQVLWRSAA